MQFVNLMYLFISDDPYFLRSFQIDTKSIVRKLIQLVTLFLLCLNTQVLSAKERQSNREVLFKVAYEQMAFILNTLSNENQFTKQLSDNEKLMLKKIIDVAEQNATFHWLEKNTQPNVHNPFKTFYYVVSHYDTSTPFSSNYATPYEGGGSQRRDVYRSYATSAQFNLQFSRDQKIFILANSEIRTGVTYNPPQIPSIANDTQQPLDLEPIYINQKIINSPKNKITFTEAVSLLIHEFGHKLGNEKKQSEVDTLAVKAAEFINSNYLKTFTAAHSKTKFYFYKFPLHALQQWVESLYEGNFLGTNAGFSFDNLRIFDEAGSLIFSETEDRVEFLNSQFFKKADPKKVMSKYNLIDWSLLTFNQVSDIEIEESQNGLFRFKLKHRQDYSPLLLPSNKPQVDVTRFNAVSNFSQFQDVQLTQVRSIEVSIDINLKSEMGLKYEAPYQIKPEVDVLVENDSRINSDLILEIRIKNIKNQNITESSFFVLKLTDQQNQEYDLKNFSKSFDNEDLIVKFKFKDFYKYPQYFKIKYIDLIYNRRNLTHYAHESHLRFILNKEIELKSNVANDKANTQNKPNLTRKKNKEKPLQLIHLGQDVENPFTLKLIFRSKEPLVSLKIVLKSLVQRSNQIQLVSGHAILQESPEFKYTEDSIETTLLLNERDFNQKQVSPQNYEVTIDLRKLIFNENNRTTPVGVDEEIKRFMNILEISRSQVIPVFNLLSLKAYNSKSESTDFSFEKPPYLTKRVQQFNKLYCSQLFN